MNALVHEWMTKAEADLTSAHRELRARKQPNYDAACFHAQQAAEKFPKAVLQARGTAFRKTHDLVELASMTDVYPDDTEAVKELEALTGYAVIYRYPGEWATRDQAKLALRIARRVRTVCLAALKEA